MIDEPHPEKKPTPRVDLLERLLRVLSERQAVMLVEDMERACEASSLRDSPAKVEIVFKRGHPAFVNITLGRVFPAPAGEG